MLEIQDAPQILKFIAALYVWPGDTLISFFEAIFNGVENKVEHWLHSETWIIQSDITMEDYKCQNKKK